MIIKCYCIRSYWTCVLCYALAQFADANVSIVASIASGQYYNAKYIWEASSHRQHHQCLPGSTSKISDVHFTKIMIRQILIGI